MGESLTFFAKRDSSGLNPRIRGLGAAFRRVSGRFRTGCRAVGDAWCSCLSILTTRVSYFKGIRITAGNRRLLFWYSFLETNRKTNSILGVPQNRTDTPRHSAKFIQTSKTQQVPRLRAKHAARGSGDG